ncbi:uncharacterized protein LOC131315012 isoform X1 [Rhododendron vialii]|uniref:uncharacterized protein LOC131315012 isoform X1 n=1 Tax=Rhododendron vialii TaxID=182163 RepID=UPI00265FC3AA|nr:uncharacterized protein LOC131315012 isoform X1 [Rhododendron vialii]
MTRMLKRLLDREQIGDKGANLDEAEEDGFFKAFKIQLIPLYGTQWYLEEREHVSVVQSHLQWRSLLKIYARSYMKQRSSHISVSYEEDFLFESDTSMVSVEIGHGSILI